MLWALSKHLFHFQALETKPLFQQKNHLWFDNLTLSSAPAVRMPSASCLKSVGSLSHSPLAAQLSPTVRQTHSSPLLKQQIISENTLCRSSTSSFLGSSLPSHKAPSLPRTVHTSVAVQCAMAETGTKEALSKLTVDDAMVRSSTSLSR